jgi:hypothetical protein
MFLKPMPWNLELRGLRFKIVQSNSLTPRQNHPEQAKQWVTPLLARLGEWFGMGGELQLA